jgi:hypothetical protein
VCAFPGSGSKDPLVLVLESSSSSDDDDEYGGFPSASPERRNPHDSVYVPGIEKGKDVCAAPAEPIFRAEYPA